MAKEEKMISSWAWAGMVDGVEPCPADSDTIENNKMTYYLFPQEMNYTILENYSPAADEVDYWAFIQYWMSGIYDFDIIDIDKSSFYIGHYSELFCSYPAELRGFHVDIPASSSRVGYDFETHKTVFMPSIRLWFDDGTHAHGLTTFVSTYVFADDGNIGATLSKAFIDKNGTARAVLGYDVLPYSGANEKDTLIRKLLFEESSAEFQYFLIDQSKVKAEDYDDEAIIEDLLGMVYASSMDSEDEKLRKQKIIEQTFHEETFTDTSGEDVKYISYIYNRDEKIIFFSDIELMRSNSDETEVRENVNKVGFISSASSLTEYLDIIVADLTINFIEVNMVIAIVCSFTGLLISIIASRFLVDTFMNKIISMCIKMKIAQNDNIKSQRFWTKNLKVEFSKIVEDRAQSVDTSSLNEVDILFK